MRISRMAVSAGLVLMFAGCGPQESLNSLFTKDDVVFDPVLVGSWIGHGKDAVNLTFEKAGDDAYRVTETERDKGTGNVQQTQYDAHLVKLGRYQFLDVVAEDRTASPSTYAARLAESEREYRFEPSRLRVGDGLYLELVAGEPTADGVNFKLRLTSAHWIYRISIHGDKLSLAQLDDEWVQKMADQGALDIAYERTGEDHKDVVLTASTEDLQRFVLDHAEAFSGAGQWSRAR